MVLEEFAIDPPEGQEWVDGAWVEKTDTTVKHSKLQATLAWLWGNHLEASQQGGAVYTELPCVTRDRPTLPHSPPLVAEIVSPTDYAEALFAKAREYLESGCLEVWLVFPENARVLIQLDDRTLVLENPTATASTQKVLPGFSVVLSDLFA